MPFRSEKQRRFMWAKHPKIAKRWTDEYGATPQKKDYSDSGDSHPTPWANTMGRIRTSHMVNRLVPKNAKVEIKNDRAPHYSPFNRTIYTPRDPVLLAHEAAHARQHEKLGPLMPAAAVLPWVGPVAGGVVGSLRKRGIIRAPKYAGTMITAAALAPKVALEIDAHRAGIKEARTMQEKKVLRHGNNTHLAHAGLQLGLAALGDIKPFNNPTTPLKYLDLAMPVLKNTIRGLRELGKSREARRKLIQMKPDMFANRDNYDKWLQRVGKNGYGVFKARTDRKTIAELADYRLTTTPTHYSEWSFLNDTDKVTFVPGEYEGKMPKFVVGEAAKPGWGSRVKAGAAVVKGKAWSALGRVGSAAAGGAIGFTTYWALSSLLNKLRNAHPDWQIPDIKTDVELIPSYAYPLRYSMAIEPLCYGFTPEEMDVIRKIGAYMSRLKELPSNILMGIRTRISQMLGAMGKGTARGLFVFWLGMITSELLGRGISGSINRQPMNRPPQPVIVNTTMTPQQYGLWDYFRRKKETPIPEAFGNAPKPKSRFMKGLGRAGHIANLATMPLMAAAMIHSFGTERRARRQMNQWDQDRESGRYSPPEGAWEMYRPQQPQGYSLDDVEQPDPVELEQARMAHTNPKTKVKDVPRPRVRARDNMRFKKKRRVYNPDKRAESLVDIYHQLNNRLNMNKGIHDEQTLKWQKILDNSNMWGYTAPKKSGGFSGPVLRAARKSARLKKIGSVAAGIGVIGGATGTYVHHKNQPESYAMPKRIPKIVRRPNVKLSQVLEGEETSREAMARLARESRRRGQATGRKMASAEFRRRQALQAVAAAGGGVGVGAGGVEIGRKLGKHEERQRTRTLIDMEKI